jgi:4-hydroxybenzoate polyprenyltransferase
MTTLAYVVAPTRLLRGTFWRDYGITMRPYLLFVSGITGIAGLALAPGAPAWSFATLALVFFLAYGFGQALTDCFQLDTDSLSAPYRPLVRGTIRRSDVLAVSLAGLTLSSIVIGAQAPAALPLCALTVVGLATYTWFKRRWWGGPLWNAWIVALVLLIGYVGAGGTTHAHGPLLGAMVAAFFGYANFVLVGYYKDIPADRATGYRTFPVVFGLARSHLVSDGFVVGAIAGAAASIATLGTTRGVVHLVAGLAFAVPALTAAAVAQVRTHGVVSDRDAYQAIGPGVHAYVLLMAAVAAAARPAWAGGLALFYAGFVATLRRRPMAEQI